ncbi:MULTISPECIES: glycosyltransferase family 4 protein [unclassified Coleofasciculus]|uniref:glycosyltransferase family 4 protein n=1 Tax=unclassified Coleofasciculus TaxID=2692782 RepID=UPI001880F8D7|nr:MULTISPECIES: glycosyltransferase family 4 protein [unclassified Coleofasciculus]MBE9125777.1 glycosyltransferase family 4 protein [Coleofasciculus sp. LEGE 07081]MBE9148450.1 glycosyltransferase family 4 protein [Coleofasciculus sp. LEGE 07092]
MDWTVVAPFIHEHKAEKAFWLTPFVPGERHQFRIIPRQDTLASLSWHNRSSRVTGYREWLGYWKQSEEAWQVSQGGIITVFPQLAAMVGVRQRLARKHIPVVAWCLNIGACYPGFKGWLARTAFKDIDRFIVHSQREVNNYSQWLELPRERFEFVPLQRSQIPVTYKEETNNPFILAMGSANRDYPTLFEAVKKLGLRTVVVVGQHTLKGLTIPTSVEVRSGLTRHECYCLAQQARVNVVPLLNHETAAGQVTIIEAMRMGRAVIATQCIGSEDYIKEGETGFLVKPHSVNDLAQAIELLWKNQELRNRLGKAGSRYAAEHLSDEAAGAALGRILDTVADEVGQC